MPERKSYLVFEAINDKRREIHVAPSSRPMHETIALYKDTLPEPIRHWKADGGVSPAPQPDRTHHQQPDLRRLFRVTER